MKISLGIIALSSILATAHADSTQEQKIKTMSRFGMEHELLVVCSEFLTPNPPCDANQMRRLYQSSRGEITKLFRGKTFHKDVDAFTSYLDLANQAMAEDLSTWVKEKGDATGLKNKRDPYLEPKSAEARMLSVGRTYAAFNALNQIIEKLPRACSALAFRESLERELKKLAPIYNDPKLEKNPEKIANFLLPKLAEVTKKLTTWARIGMKPDEQLDDLGKAGIEQDETLKDVPVAEARLKEKMTAKSEPESNAVK